jgi:glycosyltransferase involved in cell wall biosynthesis
MNNDEYQLSYIICTRNRLNFLKINLKYLFENIQGDEEIIIVDGDSSDGTKEYLESLYKAGKIHQYISEPDKNQAHGFNKALIMARGKLIKKLIDDDLFCFPAIQACKSYMLENPTYDLCISDSLETSLGNCQIITEQSRLKQYLQWKSGYVKSFTFGDVSLLLRKSSLPYLGLYDTSFTMLDYEFSLRVSYLRAKIAYYTGFNAMSIFHPNNVSSAVTRATLNLEGTRANAMYEYAGDNSDVSIFSKLKILIGKNLQELGIWQKNPQIKNENNFSSDSLEVIYDFCDRYINQANSDRQGEFL